MSYVSIAFCFTSFDKLDTRVLGLPGRAQSFFHKGFLPGPLALVFAARLCEVTSRIISMGLFARAVRDCNTLEHYMSLALIIAIDFSANVLMTAYEQGVKLGLWRNLIYGVFGVFCYVNPVLERRNVISWQYRHYYAWRILELGL